MSARSLNKVMLIGNLTRDPELRYTPQGTAVCTLGMATNRSWTPSDGSDRQEETEFHRLVAWAKLAEICSQVLYKGRSVYVEGRLQTRKWTGQDGQERTTTEIVIDTMIALGPPKQGFAGGGQYAETQVEPAGGDQVSATAPEDAGAAVEAASDEVNVGDEKEKSEETEEKKEGEASGDEVDVGDEKEKTEEAEEKKEEKSKAPEKAKSGKASEKKGDESVSEDDIPF